MANNDTSAAVVDQLIINRRTYKVLGDPAHPTPIAPEHIALAHEAVAAAKWAPFHKPAHPTHQPDTERALMPYRFYLCEPDVCRALIDHIYQLSDQFQDDPEWVKAPNSKIPPMLASAALVAVATWLPDPDDASRQADVEHRNREHLAAASSAVYATLLAAEARGLRTFWASGGVLKRAEMRRLMGIPAGEMFLAAAYIFPPASAADGDVLTGNLHDKRGDLSDWLRNVSL